MLNIAVVVVGYNRPNSIVRLLKSINQANYNSNDIALIISIDNSGDTEVASVAHNFHWKYGIKKVIEHPKRLGLKEHVLFCGNLTLQYDAVIVLEDDIIVSPSYFSYAYEAIEKYDSEDKIAGISLYSHMWNVCVNRPFIPRANGHDGYFLQYAQSWGQVWTKRMWAQFYNWYIHNNEEMIIETDMPDNVVKWPKSSWLKYFIRYVVKSDKYFLYPYISLSTNFTDHGTHNFTPNTGFQVPLLWHEKTSYNFPEFTDISLRYDVFFEPLGLEEVLGLKPDEICVDLYNSKGNKEGKKYWLTTSSSKHKLIDSFALQLRPHELNIIANIKGKEIFLYDTTVRSSTQILTNSKNRLHKVQQIKYDLRTISSRDLFLVMRYEVLASIKRKAKKLFK